MPVNKIDGGLVYHAWKPIYHWLANRQQQKWRKNEKEYRTQTVKIDKDMGEDVISVCVQSRERRHS
jgi:hypothetical protein